MRFFLKSIILISIMALTLNATLVDEKQNNQQQDKIVSGFDDEFEETEEMFDPLSGYNKVMTNFNDGFFIHVLSPTSEVYANVVHDNIRTGISNVFDNLFFPVRFINNVLQFKLANASEELGRFVINSTFGLLGIMDVAKKFELEPHKEDFGQTLGFYGVGSGFHIVVPFLGPSNLRDLVAITADSFANPLSKLAAYEPYQIPHTTLEEFGYRSFNLLNDYSFHPTQYQDLKKNAVDLYPFLRDVYEQRRNKLIEE